MNRVNTTLTRRVLSLIAPVSVADYKKIRLGSAGDGGYVLVDNLVDNSCCISVGIGGDVSFDADLADYGYDIFQYDHTVDYSPTSHPRFHFSKIGLAPLSATSENLHDLLRIISDNQITNYKRPLLKIDIEDAEWAVLDEIDPATLKIFDQICIEFHNLYRLNDLEASRNIEKIFRLLYQTHAPVHVHGNNYGRFHIINGVPVPDVIELTYVSRDSYVLVPCNELFPGEFDNPNNPELPDLFLGAFQF